GARTAPRGASWEALRGACDEGGNQTGGCHVPSVKALRTIPEAPPPRWAGADDEGNARTIERGRETLYLAPPGIQPMACSAAPVPPRLTAWLLGCLTALLLLGLFAPVVPAVRAQEGGGEAPAAGDGNNAPDAGKPAEVPKQHIFTHIIKSVGW